MVTAELEKPHRPSHDVPEEFEPGAPPVEPDEGPVPDLIPSDPEQARVVDPASASAGFPAPCALPTEAGTWL